MRILMVHNEYGKPSGEEHAVRGIGSLLKLHGHDVSWFLKSSADISYSVSGKAGAFASGIFSWAARAEMSRRLAEHPLDLVQVQNLYPLLSPSILKPCRLRGIPVVMRCPNYRLFCPTGLHLSKGKLCERCLGGREWCCVLKNCEGSLFKSLGYCARNMFARLSRSILDNVTVFVVLSEFQKRRFVEGGIPADRIEILPNFADVPERPNCDSLGEWVTFIGRVSPEKGASLFVEAARSFPDRTFAVAGDASRMPQVAANAPPNVKFLGYLSGRPLLDLYRQSRLVVVPSLCFEGFPNVIANAMAQGRPVVCSRLGGMPEIVDDGVTGLTFEPGELNDLLDKIRHLLDRPDLCRQMGQSACEKAMREYSKESVYNRLMAIYDKAIHTRTARSE
jgi:glycosyltransferase involved in cell wall biosynthesis